MVGAAPDTTISPLREGSSRDRAHDRRAGGGRIGDPEVVERQHRVVRDEQAGRVGAHRRAGCTDDGRKVVDRHRRRAPGEPSGEVSFAERVRHEGPFSHSSAFRSTRRGEEIIAERRLSQRLHVTGRRPHPLVPVILVASVGFGLSPGRGRSWRLMSLT